MKGGTVPAGKALGIILALIVSAFAAFLGGCATLGDGGPAPVHGVFTKKIAALYREESKPGTWAAFLRGKNGEESIVIIPAAFPALRFRGLPSGPDGEFTLTHFTFFVSGLTGWNEFTREFPESGTFRTGETGVELRLNGNPEALDISAGKIRRQDTYLTGDQALTALRNRDERIRSLAEWMRGREAEREFPSQKAFEEWWKPILFPELVRARKRPPEWTAPDPKKSAGAWVLGEDIKWNIRYTEAVFPEELWPVRNSGALLRDWEEAAGWIYFQFEWERIMDSLTGGIRLIKVK
jgi:hypothetical protein